MVALLAAVGAVVIVGLGELFHLARCRRVAPLAFGPTGRPRAWVAGAPLLRVAAAGLLGWGLTTLLLLPPRVFHAKLLGEDAVRHLIAVLDVSPSMKLQDSGAELKESRSRRTSAIMESLFRRAVMEQMRLSVVAVYNGAKPVVVDTRDVEVVRNILNDLPLHHAFEVGKTDLFAGLREAAKIAEHWKPDSASLIVISDGDSVSPQGMPKMPPSITETLVVGVGDPRVGKFIDGHQSRQNVPMLRQLALRLGGTFHDGNQKHIRTDELKRLSRVTLDTSLAELTTREVALIAVGVGAAILALLPLALSAFGSAWRPGVSRPDGKRKSQKKQALSSR